MDETMSPECEALCDAVAGMDVTEVSSELGKDPRVQDPETLAAYLVSMGG